MSVTSQKITRYVEVAVPLPLRTALTYRVGEGTPGCADPGARAIVPVGRRLLTGVILAVTEGAPPEPRPRDPGRPALRIRDVAELPDAAPILPPDLLSLARWASRYYVAPPGGMLLAVLPPGIARRGGVRVRRTGEPSGPLPEADRRALEAIPREGAAPLRRLSIRPSVLRRLEAAGAVALETSLDGPRVREKRERVLHPAWSDLETARAACSRAPRQREILDLLASAGPEGISEAEMRDRLGPVGQAVKALAGKGLVRSAWREIRREPHLPGPVARQRIERLSEEQAGALRASESAIQGGSPGSFLLMGVTGSGKTEVYLRAIEQCLASGRSALYLVPEITLTPLLARDIHARLGESLAILHSSLGPGERFDEWRRARSGEVRVVLGARSAVLAPLPRLGLVVVDEEQDPSYKQQEDPRYNARDLAQVRSRESGAVVILGSATPSVESYHAAITGKIGLLSLPARIHDRPMARVRVVDMRAEFLRTGREATISEDLRDAVTRRLDRGEQAIILLNRRGYAPFVLCRSCGASERCIRCSVALTYHRAMDRMACHYCGYHRGRPKVCSTCGSGKITLAGAGTERLEETLRALFPRARLARLDRDVARGRRAPAEILSAFERGDVNLLVGTQMVAKGHDFPGVTIVGVVGADHILGMPDFRAAERTFQLLTQVAGRSGRGAEPGEVVVQAYHCEHYAIETAARQDFASFYEKESRYRRIMKYPPYVALANIVVQASSPETGVRRVRQAAEAIAAAAGAGMQVIGPSVAPIARLKGRYRYQVIVKSSSRRRLSDALNEAAAALSSRGLSSSRDIVIDIDPVSLI